MHSSHFFWTVPRWKSLRLHDNNAGFEWTRLRALLEVGKLKCEAQERRPCWPALTSLLVGTPLCTTIGQRTASGFTVANVHLLAPNLQALTFGVSAMNTPTAVSGFTNFSWRNLTSFTFLGMDEDRNPTFIYHILTHAKNLKTLSLKLPALISGINLIHHKMPLHINQLPTELLANVFELHQTEESQSSRALVKLVGVCKHWKGVSFGHPQLWTTLRCAVPAMNRRAGERCPSPSWTA
ncbi:hypothetical protein FA13DRAFT_1807336 [Coprinellus micaceus]|uniref:F-box domain-containing protein n=1 Tax=Coprinellus micaceus TaxID=71717 RepID=A0A4Y7R880_COPMI|nr:hypothetical protein FA13DRAFT_1807336 [Coprinellus micaceus]